MAQALSLTTRTFLSVGVLSGLLLSSLILSASIHASEADGPSLDPSVGPIVGAVEATTVRILYRPSTLEATLQLCVLEKGQLVQRVAASSSLEQDYVIKFSVSGLKPSTMYSYRIDTEDGQTLVPADETHKFKTADPARIGHRVSVGFVSCVDIEPNGIWNEMDMLQLDTAFLMGDTPYIDNSDLNVVRTRHRQFLQMPELAALGSHTPIVGTWDDHDFGLNNGNGRNMATGKTNTRRGFTEYRAHSQYGNGSEGVYHKVDLGMMEVLLLDPRTFSQTEASPVDPTQPTCFGTEQWNWLLKSLRESQAPLKVLAMGAIWQDKKNKETDDLFTYWYERDALLDFIKTHKIGGVVLLGGDIHVSRHLMHPQRVGYDLHDFIVSPGHQRVITSLDVYHPSLQWSLVEGWQFLTLTADGTQETPKLIAEFRQPNGIINRSIQIPLSDMVYPATKDSEDELRALWSFDSDFTNRSRLGNRIDAEPYHGVEIVKNAGARGNAAKFDASKEQFLNIPRSFLDDNSKAHTISLWFQPTSLPTHNSGTRSFLFESTAEGKPSNKSSWNLSLGLRSAKNPAQVILQLYTHSLQAASEPEAAPTAISQGPFDFLVDRDQMINQWNHIAVSFDSKALNLFLNGKLVAKHSLGIPGPASEFGGLILGGHRAGTGRNFDGMIDEVAVWQRCLTETEVNAIFTNQK